MTITTQSVLHANYFLNLQTQFARKNIKIKDKKLGVDLNSNRETKVKSLEFQV